MTGWNEHTGLAVSLPIDNIDTDQLIPARFMSRPRTTGYGDYLFHDLRKTASQHSKEKFVLDRFPEATVLLGGQNFGSGSSREAAVYALVDAGIKAVLALSFGDIFRGNATNNGLLTATISSADHDTLTNLIDDSPTGMTINLGERAIRANGIKLLFHLDDVLAKKLINGWDDIDLTQAYQQEIASFRRTRQVDASWSWPDLAASE